jgi:peroxiredoxin/endonuclease III
MTDKIVVINDIGELPMKPKRLSLVVILVSLILAGCATTDVPPYYNSLMLDDSTFKLGDTFIRPPVLWKTYTFQVDRIPVAARLKTEIFHQGSTEMPKVSLNGKPAGILSPRWADLSSRDYEIFFFDRGEGFSQAFDYNTWTTADCWISPDLLKIGENKLLIITARAGTSQADDIKLKNIEIEFRYLDREDNVTDLRRKSRKLPLPYLTDDDPTIYYPPPPAGISVNINAAGPDELMQLPGMGPKTAIRLIAERTENGPFTDLNDAAKRVKRVNSSQIKKWGENAYCGRPGGEATADTVDIGIYRELKEIRQLLKKQNGKKTAGKSDSGSVCGSSSRRGPDEEALAKIKLPADPTDEEVRNYIREIRRITKDQNSFSSQDPQVEMLTRIGPEHLDMLIDTFRLNPRRSYHIKYAINRLARAEDKDLILAALPRLPDLIEAVVDNGWVEEARPILIAKLKARPDHLPTKWVTAVASFKDPETYDDLKNYFIYCWSPSMVYSAIKDLPGIDLTDAVAQAWERAKYGREFQTAMMAPVAIEFGHLDALEQAVKDIDVDSGTRVHNARKLVTRFTDARGSDNEIREWFKKNKDRLTFDKEKGRFSATGASPSEDQAIQPTPRVEGDFHLAAELKKGRYGHAAVTINDDIYVIGGSGRGGLLGSVEKFDPEKGTVETVTEKLLPRRYLTAESWDDKIYILGGVARDQDKKMSGPTAVVECYDPASGAVTTLAPMPHPRRTVASIVSDGKIYVIGGSLVDGERVGTVDIYDIAADSWSEGEMMPTARECDLVLRDGTIYALGGYDGKNSLPVFEAYDIQSNRWEKLPDLPFPLSAHHAVSDSDNIYTFGHYDDKERVSSFDFKTAKWRMIDTGYAPSRHNAVVIVGDTVYVTGGNISSAGSHLDSIQKAAVSFLKKAPTRTVKALKSAREQRQKQAFINALEMSNEGIRKQQEKNSKGEKNPAGESAVSAKTLKRGDPVPDFNVKTLDGETISLKDLRGKVVLLDFWATWHGPCRPEIPRIREAYLKYHDRGFEVIGVSLDKDRKKLEKFIEEKKVAWPQIFDGKGWNSALARLYGVHSIPRPILLDRETRVYTPNARGKELDRALAELFKDNKPTDKEAL